MYIGTGPLTSSPVIHRHPANPVLTPADVPYEARLVFNAGVTKYKGKYVMVFRNDYGQRLDSVHPAPCSWRPDAPNRAAGRSRCGRP